MNSKISLLPTKRKKTSHKLQRHRQRLPCPSCGYRIIDAGLQTHSELHVMEKGDYWNGDYYAKCNYCKADVGIRKIE